MEREHHEIATFTRNRIFTAIDDFEAAHGLTVDAGTGVFILLAQRLFARGLSPELVTTLASDAVKASAAFLRRDSCAAGVLKPAPTDERPSALVVPFRKNHRD